MSPLIRNAFIATVVITAAFFGYNYLLPESEDVPALQTDGLAAGGEEGRDFLKALISLRKIDLNLGDTIFKNEVFVNLVDMSVGLPSDPKGRPNPFKPLGEDAQVMTATTANPPAGVGIPSDAPSDNPGQ